MSFRPSIHGWPFPALPSPDPVLLGLSATPDPDPGLAGGMCRAALDRYLRGVRIDPGTPRPEPGTPLYAELVRCQATAMAGVWPRVRDWQQRAGDSWRRRVPLGVPGGRDVASRTRARWRSVRARLDAGEPVLLVLLPEADGYRRPTAAIQVLATAWRRTGSRVTLSIYDPSHPGIDDLQLAFSLSGPLDALLAGSRSVRGFFDVPHDTPARAPMRVETFEDRSVIGLNRTVLGTLHPVARGRGLELVARGEGGSLLHFRRATAGSWEGTNVTERHELGRFELHSDPFAVAAGSSLHVFGLDYVGDLVHFRKRRRWTVANVTDQRRAGPRFRLSTTPVAAVGPLGRISVLGVDANGGLVHYHGRPLLGWRAEQVPGDRIVGRPLVTWRGGALHVVGVNADGHLLHWERVGDEWKAADLTRHPGSGPSLRVAGNPVLYTDDPESMTVAAADPDGRLVAFRQEGGVWVANILADGVTGDPVATTGPAGLHLFAIREDGGPLHVWDPPTWRTEAVVGARAGLPPVPLTGGLCASGSARELRLFGRGPNDLWLLTWDADADWTAERLRDGVGTDVPPAVGDDPVLVQDRDGHPHVFFTDGRGTVQHLEPGEWREPGEPGERGEPAPGSEQRDPSTDEVAARSTGTAAPVPDDGSPPVPEHDDHRLEPMDLSLLDSWPSAPRSLRRRKEGRAARGDERAREAS